MTSFTTRDKALSLLEHPEEYPGLSRRLDLERKLPLFRYPSFEPYFSWSIFCTNKTYWLRRVVWEPSKSLPSEGAEPSTYGSEVICPEEVAETILSSLAAISLRPLLQPTSIGIDGTIRGITVGNHWFASTLRWWYLPSDDWQLLAEWFEKTTATFEIYLPESSF